MTYAIGLLIFMAGALFGFIVLGLCVAANHKPSDTPERPKEC